MSNAQEPSVSSSASLSSDSPKVVLILGGARSGKSAFAERLAADSGRSVAFIATATPGDDDMRQRIARHQASRPKSWQTLEEPFDLADAVQRAANLADVLLLDCITLWLANWMTQQEALELEQATTLSDAFAANILTAADKLLTVVASLDSSKSLIIVSNEVGLGIVPAYPLGRVYRDTLGWVNQRLAQAAAHVYLMIAGLAVDIKKLHQEISL